MLRQGAGASTGGKLLPGRHAGRSAPYLSALDFRPYGRREYIAGSAPTWISDRRIAMTDCKLTLDF